MVLLKITIKSKIFLLSVFIFSCISLQRGIRSDLFFSGTNVAVYKLEESPIKLSSSESSTFILPEDRLLKIILNTLRKEKSILQVNGKEILWDMKTVEELLPVVKDILSKANKGKSFFLVVKEEDTLSPFSRIFRTTLYMNRDGNVLQMVFGELNNNINFGTQFSFQDWANPSFFKINCEKKKILLFDGRLESAFQFKKDSSCAGNDNLPADSLDSRLENLNNYKWVQVDLEKAVLIDKEKKQGSETGDKKTREKRLKELMDLYKKGLINKEDYEIKKAEILGEL